MAQKVRKLRKFVFVCFFYFLDGKPDFVRLNGAITVKVNAFLG